MLNMQEKSDADLTSNETSSTCFELLDLFLKQVCHDLGYRCYEIINSESMLMMKGHGIPRCTTIRKIVLLQN